MESLKRVFLFLLVGLFIISFSSAGLLDPNSELSFYEESKNGKYGYYEINDTDLWFFNNKQVKTIELLENEYSVFTAWNIKEYNIYRPTRLFDNTNYLDKEQKKDRGSVISSETHLYREWEIKTRTINKQSCLTYETTPNQTQVCSELQDNSYEEEYEGWSYWKLYDFRTVQEGRYQSKTIVTRDSQNTGVVDWVDGNEGWDLNEWATWWDLDWAFKREISNLNGTISSLYNITYNANMKLDFSDLRFLDNATESVELNYTIISKVDSTEALVRVDNENKTSIYMYYGNSAAADNSNFDNVYLGTVGSWIFDTNNGNDFSSSGNNGEVTGAVLTDNGYIGNAYLFDEGIGDGINMSSSISGDTTVTGTVWFKTNSCTTGTSPLPILNLNNDGTSKGFLIGIKDCNNGKISILIQDVAWGTNSPISYNDDTWHFAVIIRSGISYSAYIDGSNSPVSTLTNAGGTFGAENRIGSRQISTTSFKGTLDEVNIYDRALTSDEMQYLYEQTRPSFVEGPEDSVTGVSTELIYPENDQNVLNNTVTFNFTSVPKEVNLTNATLYIWWSNGTLVNTNFTTLSGNESINTTLVNILTDGMYKWNAETCGENVNCSFATSNNSFIVHVTPITIDILEPNGTIGYITLGDNQTLSWQLSEPGENLTEHVTNCSFTYNSVITDLTLNNCIVTNTTEFLYVNGVNTLTFNATDIFNLSSNKTTTWEYIITEINQTFEENISEGALDDFSLLLNISDSSTLEDSTFSYNGTNYTTTIVFSGGLYLISSLITSPTVAADTNFSFNFFFTVDGVNYTTTINEQLVINSLFDVCGGISNDTLLNMSLLDEETGGSINGDIEIIASIVSQSSGVTVGEINNTFSNVEYGAICFTPESAYSLYFLNTEIKYSSDGYVSELYYIQNSDMTDYPRNLSLFDLNQTDSTEFVVTFQNDAFIFVEGAIIQLQRKYIGENVFKTVEAPITADGGKAIVHIDLNTNIYRASIVKDGALLKFFDEIVFSCENELSGECTQQLRGDVNPNNNVPIENLIDFSYSVSVSDENNTVEVLFAIPSGTPSSVNVLLTQIDMFGNLTSCNTTVITSAGSITCDFSNTIEKSLLQLTISKDGTQLAITNYGVDPELDMDGINFFIVFLFLISLVGMAIASPEWMMIIGVMVFMISGTMLLLQGMSLAMGLGAIAWLVVTVIIIILKMAKQEDR